MKWTESNGFKTVESEEEEKKRKVLVEVNQLHIGLSTRAGHMTMQTPLIKAPTDKKEGVIYLHTPPAPRPTSRSVTWGTPILRQASRKFSTFLRHLAMVSLGCRSEQDPSR